jgi:hypothetical protein
MITLRSDCVTERNVLVARSSPRYYASRCKKDQL